MSRAHDTEMTFVLLARDAAAPVAIRAWVEERIRLGKNVRTDPQIVEALECASEMSRDRKYSSLLHAAIRAQQKLRAYVGVCAGDKELNLTILPMLQAAIDESKATL